MTTAQTTPLSRRVDLADGVLLTKPQREWLAALDSAPIPDRPLRIIVEPARSDAYALVVEATFGRSHDYETNVWTVRSTGTAEIW